MKVKLRNGTEIEVKVELLREFGYLGVSGLCALSGIPMYDVWRKDGRWLEYGNEDHHLDIVSL